jgi:phosphate/sulfate permease
MISYLFANIAFINEIDASYIYWYGALIFLSVVSLTELMDQHPFAVWWEVMRVGLALGLLYWQQDWFGASQFFSPIVSLLTGYFLLSLLMAFWFSKTERRLTNASILH